MLCSPVKKLGKLAVKHANLYGLRSSCSGAWRVLTGSVDEEKRRSW